MKYRKKPVIIEAFQMTKERRQNNIGWPGWLKEAWQKEAYETNSVSPINFISDGRDKLTIRTLEGDHQVSWNDWIIKGVKGELYPIKNDIFEATYDKVEE